ncbi:MAG: phosphoenolpyruvate carboxykinase (ATP) [Candidatus Koribacter versatilis]|uniref:Phosphoenolpyruvate carboxykinase (ATP) n=1 Tax=Candidatus Korobacter versatilis TaxID=658062 RepID=A0A932AA62_9BACT|nr:phosphoenolpyruvate carboxykinase (ATP) [Candidatus Koribacter versatilis]
MSTGTQLSELEQLLEGGKVRRNLKPKDLTEAALARKEAMLASNGALTAETGKRTGRSPKDRFIVKDALTAGGVDWGAVNQAFDPEKFDALLTRVAGYLKDKELYVQDLFAGADPKYRLPVRFVNEYAWHNLFVRQLFVRPSDAELQGFAAEFTVICAPGFAADPQRDGTNSDAFILLNFTRKIVLIGGTKYAGEMKKSIFGVLNFALPPRDVFPMHCSANVGAAGDTALFFGLSGTGKTTLSADPARRLIGDDEHGWSPTGVFNFEGGCYAKCIKLSKTNEPQIWNALRSGAVLENVVLDPETRKPDYDDYRLTENTRAAYPVEFIENAVIPGIGGHPKQIVFLTADAFGVLPPISRLSPEQAMYHFLSGYTAKVAGTEAGVKEPQATFSTCFGAPFMPRAPKVYAEMLGNRMRQHGAQCWLVNTGWYGGPYGTGQRMSLPHTRMMVRALLEGKLNDAEFIQEKAFGLTVPGHIEGIPERLLDPRNAWADKMAFDKKAAELAERFARNFEKFDAPAEVRAAGPAAVKK